MSFPSSLDALTTSIIATEVLGLAGGGLGLAPILVNVSTAINALETKVGIDSSAVATSLDYLIKNASSIDPGHHHTNSTLDSLASSKVTGLPTFPSGTIVGTTDTQALTNKTLTTPVLASFYQDAGLTKLMTVPNVASDTLVVLAATQELSNKTHAGDFKLKNATDNIQVNSADPKRGLYVPVFGMFPATTNGCAAIAQVESTTNKVNYKVLDFDAATEEYACFELPAPDYWDLSTITVQFHWTAASGSDDVIWGLQGLARSNDDAIDTAYGTAQEVTDTLITAGDEHITAATAAITVGGTPAKGDNLYFRVYRKAAAAGDTLAVDARLIGIRIKFGISQYDDQ